MFDKNQFLISLAHETAVCKHIHGQLPLESLGFSLGPNMRTTLELLRYLTRCAFLPAWAMTEGDWGSVGARLAEADSVSAPEFPARMDEQLQAVVDILAGLSEKDLSERRIKLPWGAEEVLGAALVNTSLKFLTAYRMQLFLHAKASGAASLGTSDCWLGKAK